jgi:hypothetical protein
MCTLRGADVVVDLLVTDCVLEIFLDFRRSRSSMFMKSMLPPKFSW